jgi:hypothetical protein
VAAKSKPLKFYEELEAARVEAYRLHDIDARSTKFMAWWGGISVVKLIGLVVLASFVWWPVAVIFVAWVLGGYIMARACLRNVTNYVKALERWSELHRRRVTADFPQPEEPRESTEAYR